MVKEMLLYSDEVIASKVKPSTFFAKSRAAGSPRGVAPRDERIVKCFLKYVVAGGLPLISFPALAAPDTASSMLTVLLSLGLILGGFVAVAWVARRYLPGMGTQGVVKVVGTTAVGTRERVVVVEVDNTWLLLGVGGGNVRLLHTLPKPEQTQESAR